MKKKYYFFGSICITAFIGFAFFFFYGVKDNNQEKPFLLSKIDVERAFQNLDESALAHMHAKGESLFKWLAILDKTNSNLVTEIAPEHAMKKGIHYPKEDVFDVEYSSQYYYHTHRAKEHGHFHLFMHTDGISSDLTPVVNASDSSYVHIVGISIGKDGMPQKLFLTNQFVTGDNVYSKEDMESIIDSFQVQHAYPSWPLNQCINAMVVLFKPQILMLYEKRDALFAEMELHQINLQSDALQEVLLEVDVDIFDQIDQIEKVIKAS